MSNFTKFFRNGKTFSAYCRMRYGQSKEIWADTTLWQKNGIYAIAFDQEAADAKFKPKEEKNPLKPKYREAAFDAENYEERRMEDMMDYMTANGNLDAYYEDRDAVYAY